MYFELPPMFLILVGIVIMFIIVSMLGGGRRIAGGEPRTCRTCGASHPPYARYCRRCGRELY